MDRCFKCGIILPEKLRKEIDKAVDLANKNYKPYLFFCGWVEFYVCPEIIADETLDDNLLFSYLCPVCVQDLKRFLGKNVKLKAIKKKCPECERVLDYRGLKIHMYTYHFVKYSEYEKKFGWS